MSNYSHLSFLMASKHPLTQEITDAVRHRDRGHTWTKPTHALLMLANTLEGQYGSGVAQANLIAALGQAIYENPAIHTTLLEEITRLLNVTE